MTRPSQMVIAAAQNASLRLADRDTPFVMNDWYVAAFGDEIKDQLLARTLLGRRLVFYRTTDQRVVALEDGAVAAELARLVGSGAEQRDGQRDYARAAAAAARR